MPTITVELMIPADEFLALYRGTARDVVATSIDGRTVRFPAKVLQPFVTQAGIHGRFSIEFDQHFKFKKITQLS
ncbi:DUF2835 domain-containing protein [Endozoicomonas sp. SM1973]|uniref:DUF2835 domain-containing protein n=1 Tax=Spartinivicinus marinus TaxID=2994442 RepID=A0A853I4M9_9GAMM|nr:DUF2835 domain-containing protein [Spartinivicinus marinus]MCX4029846.1 DUF2835 domain-containing protein [Spartinivicinus marinus]NYZ64911.1 DUF2835 domain-containing protein [Spartinivicinus marinus]